MQITESTNDQLMCIAAFRYSLGRSSYIVSCCQEWLQVHWNQLTKETQNVIVRDIGDFLLDEHRFPVDNKSWQILLRWIWNNIEPTQQNWCVEQTRWKGRIEDLIDV